VSANQAHYPLSVLCRLLKVSCSGFYAWKKRPMSQRARADVCLLALIRAIHESSYCTYGAPRIHAELRQEYGVYVARKRVARLMRTAGLKGVQKRRFICTTRSGDQQRWAPDLVDRDFTATEPDKLWVADATYIATAEGFL
jgi:putative transposase